MTARARGELVENVIFGNAMAAMAIAVADGSETPRVTGNTICDGQVGASTGPSLQRRIPHRSCEDVPLSSTHPAFAHVYAQGGSLCLALSGAAAAAAAAAADADANGPHHRGGARPARLPLTLAANLIYQRPAAALQVPRALLPSVAEHNKIRSTAEWKPEEEWKLSAEPPLAV